MSFHDMETYYENKKIYEYLKSHDMLKFTAEFQVYTNIIPIIHMFLMVTIKEPVFYEKEFLELGTNSFENQNNFHITFHNPFKEVTKIYNLTHSDNVHEAIFSSSGILEDVS